MWDVHQMQCNASIESKVQPKNLFFFSFAFCVGSRLLRIRRCGAGCCQLKKEKGWIGSHLVIYFILIYLVGWISTKLTEGDKIECIPYSILCLHIISNSKERASHLIPSFFIILYIYFKFFLFLSYSKVWS